MVLAFPARALAEDVDLTEDRLPRKELIEPAPQKGPPGAAILTLSGQVGVLGPSAGALEPHTGGGASFAILLRRLDWPVFVGFGAGLIMFDASMRTEVRSGTTFEAEDGTLTITTSTSYGSYADHTAEFYHVDFPFRFQPFWGLVRPYVEGVVGIGIVNEGVHRPELHSDRTAGVGALFGATLGIDWRLYTWGPNREFQWDLILTTGVRGLITTPVPRPTFASLAEPATDNEPLKMWVPFVGIGFAGKSGPDWK